MTQRGKVSGRPVVGVIGNAHVVENRFTTQMVGERNLRAIAEVAKSLQPGSTTKQANDIAEQYIRDNKGVPSFLNYT